MAEALAEKTKIKDDEFDIHGDLAVSEPEDKSFVVLYDSSKGDSQAKPHDLDEIPAPPSLDELNEDHMLGETTGAHPEDAYIDDILSSDDIDNTDAPTQGAAAPRVAPSPPAMQMDEHDDGPIALSSEELDGILEMGPSTEEEFHPDFPVDHAAPETAPGHAMHESTMPGATPGMQHDLDDDELPIALSDEDLDEILLEEEGHPSPVMAPAPKGSPGASGVTAPGVAASGVAAPGVSAPAALDDDEEPIALSDDELDHILADAEAGHPAMPASHGDDEVLTLDEDPEITMIDDSSGALETSSTAASHDAGGFFDSEDDEPITLSDEELDGILSSAPEENAPQTPRQSDEMALGDMPDDGTVELAPHAGTEIEDEEPIALSNEELDGILMDSDGATEVSAGEAAPADAAAAGGDAGFFDSDDDEPIALSADELDGIAATATHEDAPPMADLPPDQQEADPTAMDARYADVDDMEATPDAGQAHEEDDGPIALSSDELDGIVADAREVTPEAPMMPLSPMDTGADEPSLADNMEKPATVFEEDLEAATLIHEDDKAAAAPPPDNEELKSVMGYLDNLLGELPDDVIEKFAQSEYFKMYQKIMDKLGL